MTESQSRAHLLARIGVLEERIRRLVADRRAVDPAPDDPFRGLYISDEVALRLTQGDSVSDAGHDGSESATKSAVTPALTGSSEPPPPPAHADRSIPSTTNRLGLPDIAIHTPQ